MLEIVNFPHPKLNISHWQISKRQSWCVLSKNGSEKSLLTKLLTGELPNDTAEKCQLPIPTKVAIISFESQQQVYERELKLDASDFLDANDIGTQAKDFLPADKLNHPFISDLGLANCLEQGYRQLSTGESRKLLILEAIFKGVELLVIDNPFDSLDVGSCTALSSVLSKLSVIGVSVVLLTGDRHEVPNWCDRIALLESDRLNVIAELPSSQTQQLIDQFFSQNRSELQWPTPTHRLTDYPHDHLVKLRNGRVYYHPNTLFEQLDVCIKPLQHTLITGANGCGKSTLMQLITGDCTQCYSNDIEVLGFKRGSGESIWQLKQQMGIVSAQLHRQYRVSGDLLTVIVSGFYDSIGLYQKPEPYQIEVARQWLTTIDLIDQQYTPFKQLSYGEQRLVLIVRALVKFPYLLILDEPTQGLDAINRHKILNFLDRIAEQKHSTIILVSHRQDEHLPFFNQHIKM